ncbi:MAG TPA: DUF3857 domain-containing protein [Candidatus Dormibacteraeota bacterium]|nr:DUF3857 domain-containing protein [Candidatus Dormibacteraeota bacterium]
MHISRHALTLLALIPAILADAAPLAGVSPALQSPEGKPVLPQKPSNSEDSPSYIIEQYSTSFRFENDGTSRRELRVRARVLSDEGAKELSRLVFDYDRQTEQLEISDVEIHQANGGSIGVLPHAVVDRPVAATKDAPAYEDAREKSVRVPGLKNGDALRYTVTLNVIKPPATGHFWLEHSFLRDGPVKEELFEISIPRGRPILFKTAHGSASFTTTDDISGLGPRRIYRWNIAHDARPAKPREPRSDDTAPSSENTDEPDIQLSTFLSWDDLARWYQKQWAEPDGSDPAVRAKGAALAVGRATVSEKLASLYTFVSQKIRTIELSADAVGYRTQSPVQVLTQSYGTALDKHMLLAALAKTMGLRAIPVLIGKSREMTERVPLPAQFTQLVTAVRENGEWVWLDTGPQVAPFRLLAANLRNKRGLAIQAPADGGDARSESPAQWMTTPPDPPFPATQIVTVRGELNAEGKLTARVHYAVRGDTELLLRVAFYRAPQNQWKNLAQLLAISDGFRAEVTGVTASNPEETEKPFEVEYRIAQEGMVRWKNQKAGLQLPLPSFGLPELPLGTGARKQGGPPIDLGTPLSVSAVAIISLPNGLTTNLPIPIAVKRDYAEYRSTYRAEANKITSTRELRFLLRQLPAERASDYSAFVRAVRRDEAQQVALERPAPAQQPQATSAKTRAASRPNRSLRFRPEARGDSAGGLPDFEHFFFFGG